MAEAESLGGRPSKYEKWFHRQMTESEWLELADPWDWLGFNYFKSTARKKRLFCCACVRRFWHLLTDDRCRRAIEVAERYADGIASKTELEAANLAVADVAETESTGVFYSAFQASWDMCPDGGLSTCLTLAHAISSSNQDEYNAELATQCLLLHDILGNPFRPSPSLSAAVLNWNDGTVRRIAEVIYEEREFDHLPILADALVDAGCEDEELIQHCRSEGPHVRGCWAVDALLGKT